MSVLAMSDFTTYKLNGKGFQRVALSNLDWIPDSVGIRYGRTITISV